MNSLLKNKTLWTLVIIVAFIGLFISLLPKPLDIDLTNIGNGKKSVVFVYDPNRLVSNQQSIEFNHAKEITGETINYLIARTGYPETDAFMQQYKAEIAELLFFDANGQLVDRAFAPMSADNLVNVLN